MWAGGGGGGPGCGELVFPGEGMASDGDCEGQRAWVPPLVLQGQSATSGFRVKGVG